MMDIRSLRLEQQKHIAASPEQVWCVLTDIDRWTHWNPTCLQARGLEGEPWKPGYRFTMTLRMAGRPITFRPTVVEADPPHLLRWSSKRLSITGERTFRLKLIEDESAAIDGITQITDEKLFTSKLVPVALLYPRQVVRDMSNRWLQMLMLEVERDYIGVLPPSFEGHAAHA